MRTLLLLLLAVPAYAEERTWTIATDVYTAEAELVAVRGDLAYLRIAGKVESIPLERLSAADHKYIASLALAPVVPGPADDGVAAATAVLPGPAAEDAAEELLPLPGDDFETMRSPSEQVVGEPAAQATVYHSDQYGRTTIVPPAGNPGDQRFRRLPQQGPDNRASNSDRKEDEPRGLRARRLERQRAGEAARRR